MVRGERTWSGAKSRPEAPRDLPAGATRPVSGAGAQTGSRSKLKASLRLVEAGRGGQGKTWGPKDLSENQPEVSARQAKSCSWMLMVV